MTPENYHYYAFISYSHADEKWAKWLQRELETYRLPSAIHKETEGRLPKAIRPVFRDRTDIEVGRELKDILHKELENSRFLIVICSPNIVESPYVNLEVELFQGMGRGDRIIPFIVKGKPDAENREDRCYCPALATTVLGASVPEEGREKAFVQTVARILDLNFDRLYGRHQRRQRQKLVIRSVMAAVMFLFLTIGGYFAWDYYVPKHRYFADYVERWHVPEGLFPLTREQVAHRQSHYHFVYQRHRLQRVSHENSAGTPVHHTDTEALDRPMILQLTYDDRGALVSREHLDRNGQSQVTEKIDRPQASDDERPCYFVEFKNKLGKGETLRSSTTSMDFGSLGFGNGIGSFQQKSDANKSAILRYQIYSDGDGFVSEMRYHRDTLGTPACDADGVWGMRYERDDLGRAVKVVYLGETGEPTRTKIGLLGKRHTYQGACRVRTAWFGENDMPWLNEKGYSSEEISFDDWGNFIQETYLNTYGELCFQKEDGFAKGTVRYDERGNVEEMACFGMDGKPCLCKQRWAKRMMKYDGQGNMIEVVCFGIDEKPCLQTDGFSKGTMKYDARGNVEEIAIFGVDEKPCYFKSQGWAKCIMKYNEQGNPEQISCFDVNGKSCLNTKRFQTIKMEYDNRGNIVKVSCFGVDEKPCLHREGWMTRTMQYDARGNLQKETCLGYEGKPCLTTDGNSMCTYTYDLQGNMTQEANFGTDGLPCLDIHGVSKYVYAYDPQGNMTQEANFGTDGLPCLDIHGVSKYVYAYDPHGNKIEEANSGTNGQLCVDNNGVAKYIYVCDTWGNTIDEAYLGVNGLPCVSMNGFARQVRTYNLYGSIIEEVYFGADGKPCLLPNGYSRITMEYDSCGNMQETACFGLSGEAVLNKSTGGHKMHCAYDSQGNVTEVSFYDVDGKLCLSSGGFAKVTNKYDEIKYITETTSYGVDGNPCFATGNDYARIVKKHDAYGNRIAVSYYGTDGKPCRSKTADIFGYQCLESFFDLLSKERNVETWTYSGFDEALCGYWAKRIWCNKDGDPTTSTLLASTGECLAQLCMIFDSQVNGQSDQASLMPGDIILEYDGAPVTDLVHFESVRSAEMTSSENRGLSGLVRSLVSEKHTIQISRDGEILTFLVRPDLLNSIIYAPIAAKFLDDREAMKRLREYVQATNRNLKYQEGKPPNSERNTEYRGQ